MTTEQNTNGASTEAVDVNTVDSEAVEAGVFNANTKSSSDILRTTRKDKKIAVETVAAELNLSSSVIRAIESDNWEALPEATYVRGYVRSYANFLDLDADEVLINFRYKNTESDLNLDAMPRGGVSYGSVSSRKVPSFLKKIVVLGALFFGAYYFFGDQIKQYSTTMFDKAETLTNSAVSTTQNAAAVAETAVADVSEKAVQAVSNAGDAVSEKVDGVDAEKPVVVPTGLKETLSMSFTGISWVDISDKSGRKVIYKSFSPGETVKIKALKPLKIFIGNVEAVKVSYEGQEISLSEHQEEDHAKFTLD